MTEGKYQNKTDEELVELTLENQDNFLYLMKRYEQKLFSYILRISNLSPEEAEDVLQDVFIKVYKNLNGFDASLKFSSWIYRITHNEVISNFRKKSARPQKVLLGDDNEMLENLESEINIGEEIDRDFLQKNIYQVLDKLDQKYREVLILKFLEERNYQEISDILRKPMGTVATLIARAKKSFEKEVIAQGVKNKF